MTPSKWHNDDSQAQDSGHDEMQVAVWRWLRDRGPNGLKARLYQWQDVPCQYDRSTLELEQAFSGTNGHIAAFADICETFVSGESKILRAYEIKPRIYSVGSVLRQCSAMAKAIEHSVKISFSRNPTVFVYPVVRANDQKLELLQAVSHVFVWDGEQLRYERATG